MKQTKEQKKLVWMKVNFIEECKKMLKLMKEQEIKVKEVKMKNNIDNYLIEQLRKNRKVKIEIIGRKTKQDYLEMDWIINNKFILRDFPFEVFEGEEGEELKQNKNGKRI